MGSSLQLLPQVGSFKMRFSAIFVLVCALVVDAQFGKKREKERRRQLAQLSSAQFISSAQPAQRSYFRPRPATPRKRPQKGKREAEAEAEPSAVAEPVADADADAVYGYYGHGLGYTYGYPLSYAGSFYGHGLGYGHGFGRGYV